MKTMFFQRNGLVCVLLFLTLASFGQAKEDSLAIANAKWEKRKIAPGVKLMHKWFNQSLFGANQNINVLEVKLHGRNEVDVEADAKQLRPTSEFGGQSGALAGVNGTFFDMKSGGSVDYIRLNGTVLNRTKLDKNETRSFHQRAAIVTNHTSVAIVSWDGAPDWEEHLQGDDVMVSGPLLLQNGNRTVLDTTSFVTARHPRTALALKGNKLLLIAVDGRNERAAGMSLYELASLVKWLNAEQAINLDGGGSTTMWVKGFPDSGIVNHPSDNKKMMQTTGYKQGMDLDNLAADTGKWDHGDERPVANAIFIYRRKKGHR